MAERNTSDPAVARLTGSSLPTGDPPAFEPLATAGVSGGGAESVAPHPFRPLVDPMDSYLTLPRPALRSQSDRLADLCGEHMRLVRFHDEATCVEDRADDGSPEQQRAELAIVHADRMLEECETMIEAIPARSIRDLGLKARVLSWKRHHWWDRRFTDEPTARNLVDDILNLAGLDRVRYCDQALSALLPGYDGPPQHLPTSSPCEIGRRYAEGSEDDPVFATIATHRAAYAAWLATSIDGNLPDDAPEGKVESAALRAVVNARPTTVPGLRAWTEYLAEIVERDGDFQVAEEALPGLAAAARELLPAMSSSVVSECAADPISNERAA